MPELHFCDSTVMRQEGSGRDAGGFYLLFALHCSICGARISGGIKVYQ